MPYCFSMPLTPFPMESAEGLIHQSLGNCAEAVASFQSALAIRFTYVDAWLNLGKVQIQAGKLKEAIDSFIRVVQLDPGREETRMHIHIHSENGEAKFWLEPEIELAKNYRLSRLELRQIENIIEEHYDSFTAAWQRHFGG